LLVQLEFRCDGFDGVSHLAHERRQALLEHAIQHLFADLEVRAVAQQRPLNAQLIRGAFHLGVVHVRGQEFLSIRLPQQRPVLRVVERGGVNAQGRGRLSRSFIGSAELQFAERFLELAAYLARKGACDGGLRRHREVESGGTNCANSRSGN
jgi:hypothetical protein